MKPLPWTLAPAFIKDCAHFCFQFYLEDNCNGGIIWIKKKTKHIGLLQVSSHLI